MPDFRLHYQFKARPWKYDGPNGWWFVSLPAELSAEIRSSFKTLEQGWGRLTASARIGNKEWKTAIWFDTGKETYLLPIKAEVRKELDMLKELEVTVLI